jgi:type IV pilus assembly protein PilW
MSRLQAHGTPARTRQRGLSLVEILVSLVIGLVVVGAVLLTYLGSGQSSALQTAASQMNEDAQVGLSILARDLMNAGYTLPTGASAATGRLSGPPPSGVFGCDLGFKAPNKLGELLRADDCATAGSSAAIEVVYEADLDNTSPNANRRPTDCAGRGIPTTPALSPAPWLRNRYHIANHGSTGRPELRCASNVPGVGGVALGAEPLLENVELLHLRYLEAVSPLLGTAPDAQRFGYRRASEVTDWGNVLAVRICLQMRSATPVLSSEDPTSYLDCDQNTQSSSGRLLRRSYFTTVALRNRLTY